MTSDQFDIIKGRYPIMPICEKNLTTIFCDSSLCKLTNTLTFYTKLYETGFQKATLPFS
jgi:hypothetical protein